MKKILSVALTLALAGCAGGSNTTQLLLTQSSGAEVMPLSSTEPSNVTPETVKPAPKMPANVEPMPKPAPKVAATATPKPMPMKEKPMVASTKAEKPMMKMPATTSSKKYTIQVIALSHNKGFTEYMDKLPSDKPVWSNKKMVEGLPWYTLLYGEFPSKEAAKSALNALPKTIKEYGPFIRSFSSIKGSSTPDMTRLN
ncbi:SPOR domain-containing protein [Enterovibrio norvegicus]|uniref:SPOR domain-containing protein n=1 Tax=Enterovibrio norvegicus TaxID=188144 RepID=UPI003D0E2C82